MKFICNVIPLLTWQIYPNHCNIDQTIISFCSKNRVHDSMGVETPRWFLGDGFIQNY